MSVQIEKTSGLAFAETQANFPSSNFLQTHEMGQLQTQIGRFTHIDYLRFTQKGQSLGQALVVYRKRYKIFTEALLLHGPLLDFGQTASARAALSALEGHFKQNGVAKFYIYPYAVDTIKNEQLEIQQDQLMQPLHETLVQAGYQHHFDLSQSTVVNNMFVKDLTAYPDTQAIYDAFSPSLKRDLKKFSAFHVKVKELAAHELGEFYQILEETGQRKGFAVQDFSYFKAIKDSFGDKAKFMLAYLDCQAYQAYLTENIQAFEDKIKALEEGPQKKRTKGQIADARDQLGSYYKRQEQFQAMGIQSATLPLSSYLFMLGEREVVSFSGGNYEEYMNFGGATLLHWEMIQLAKNHGLKTLNFYGTIETDAAGQGQGNFNFKRQFGGQLLTLMGQYSKTLKSSMKLIEKIKK